MRLRRGAWIQLGSPSCPDLTLELHFLPVGGVLRPRLSSTAAARESGALHRGEVGAVEAQTPGVSRFLFSPIDPEDSGVVPTLPPGTDMWFALVVPGRYWKD